LLEQRKGHNKQGYSILKRENSKENEPYNPTEYFDRQKEQDDLQKIAMCKNIPQTPKPPLRGHN
jgi:hypothetical protein